MRWPTDLMRRIPSERMTELNNSESDAMEEGKRKTERANKKRER